MIPWSLPMIVSSLQLAGTHQIRCHLAHLGHPLVGDTKYGGRMALWCDQLPLHCLLMVATDLSGKPLRCFAPVPPDFLVALVAMCNAELQQDQWQQLFRKADCKAEKS